ncbi:MAG: hypothetical protein ABJQ29_03745 [Luteolibacter sp.]
MIAPSKKTPLRLLLTLLVFSVLSIAHLQAKEGASKFSCVSWDNLPFTEILYRNGTETIPLEIGQGRRAQHYPLGSDGSFELYVREQSSEGKEELRLIGKAAFQPGAKQMLFLIGLADPKSKLPLVLIGVDDSLSTFPAGSFRFANFTNQPLKVAFGNVAETLRPAQIEVYKAKMAPDGGLMSLIVMDSKGKPIFARRLFGQPRDRSMVFITPPQTPEGGLSIRILPEIVPEKPDEP